MEGLSSMAMTALGSAYVISSEGAERLLEMQEGGSAPVSQPGFVSGRPADAESRDRRLSELQRLVVGRFRG